MGGNFSKPTSQTIFFQSIFFASEDFFFKVSILLSVGCLFLKAREEILKIYQSGDIEKDRLWH